MDCSFLLASVMPCFSPTLSLQDESSSLFLWAYMSAKGSMQEEGVVLGVLDYRSSCPLFPPIQLIYIPHFSHFDASLVDE
jgi:hypothetical protein